MAIQGCQKQSPVSVLYKDVLRDFAKFQGKHLFQSLFYNRLHVPACNFIKK